MRKLLLLAVAVLVTLAPVAVFAQVENPPPDYRRLIVDLISAVTPVLTVVVVWAFKLAWAKLPASVVVFAAPVLGIVLNYLAAWIVGQTPSDPIVAALLGAAGVYLRELLTTLGSKGLSGSVTVTKSML